MKFLTSYRSPPKLQISSSKKAHQKGSKLAAVTTCILTAKSRFFSQEPDPLKNTAAKKYALLIADNGR